MLSKKFNKLFILILGVLTLPIRRLLPVKKNVWVFGSGNGLDYSDNSKYFFEFILKKHPEINAIWLTRSKKVITDLKKNDYKVIYNLSLKGIYYSIFCEVAVFCVMRSDFLFVDKKKNRKIVNLWHGMPMKKIGYDYGPHRSKNIKGKLWDKFVIGFTHKDVSLITSTSDYFSTILKSAFRNENIVVTGQPRTDVFGYWTKTKVRKKLGFNPNDKLVTYMPTHRSYGKGGLNPRIFENNEQAIQYFKCNNIKIIWKFHKNMLHNYQEKKFNNDVFFDLSKRNVDPQELLFITDILITDYSSCYIDFLLLKRPVIFYLYDNYEEEDNELYFSPNDHSIGVVVNDEDSLLEKLKGVKGVSYNIQDIEYHKFIDYHSSDRIFAKIISLLI